MIDNKLRSGVNWSWLAKVSSDHPGHLYKYILVGPSKIELNASINGPEIAVDVNASVTKNYRPGRYQWALYAYLDDDNRHLINYGKVEIEPDFEALGVGHDPRSYNERMLDAINKVIEGRVVKDVESYTIDDRSLNRIPILELHRLRRSYQIKVNREKGLAGRRPRVVKVRFNNGHS